MYTSIQIPEKNISGSTWNVEASAVQKWNREAVAGAAGGHTGDPRADLSHTTNFMLLYLNWPKFILFRNIFLIVLAIQKIVQEQKNFVPEKK